MSEEFKDFTATPTLTLNPVAEESAVPAMAQETRVQPNEAGWDDSMLSAEETDGSGFFQTDRSEKFQFDHAVWCRRTEENGGLL